MSTNFGRWAGCRPRNSRFRAATRRGTGSRDFLSGINFSRRPSGILNTADGSCERPKSEISAFGLTVHQDVLGNCPIPDWPKPGLAVKLLPESLTVFLSCYLEGRPPRIGRMDKTTAVGLLAAREDIGNSWPGSGASLPYRILAVVAIGARTIGGRSLEHRSDGRGLGHFRNGLHGRFAPVADHLRPRLPREANPVSFGQ